MGEENIKWLIILCCMCLVQNSDLFFNVHPFIYFQLKHSDQDVGIQGKDRTSGEPVQNENLETEWWEHVFRDLIQKC